MPEGGDEGEDEEHNDKDGDASTGEIGDCCGGGVTGRKNDRGRWGTAMIKKERTRKRLDLDASQPRPESFDTRALEMRKQSYVR